MTPQNIPITKGPLKGKTLYIPDDYEGFYIQIYRSPKKTESKRVRKLNNG